jgi:UDP-N-acetylglucosamine 4,6-dehydratase
MRKRILITGGTGFLGRHLALALKGDWEVVLGARNHQQAFNAEAATGCKFVPMDVTDIESVRDAFRDVKPHVVIHAAATKFVDLAEREPFECISINVVGSQNVARAAMDAGVELVIGVSTDKAAPPVRNTYGLSKALMERLFCTLDAKSETRFLCVRYGNVVWSTGSVFPIWHRMHSNSKKIQSTGPDMSRYFFSIEDAVRLVTTALAGGERLRGTVLSREMKSAVVSDILDTWVGARGGSWEKAGERPGDRPYECLIGDQELEYTREEVIDGIRHYVISFNRPAEKPVTGPISSTTAPRLSSAEIRTLIESAPAEYR